MNDFLRILVPLDGSTEAESVLAAAAPLFQLGNVRFTFFRVTSPLDPVAPAREYLHRVRDTLLHRGPRPEIRMEWGDPSTEILWHAHTDGFDFIAMTTHGRTGIKRLFGGSVAEEVVRKSRIPVLLHRPGSAARDWSRIVVPLDGSPLAEAVLPEAFRVARLLGAEVHVVEAVVPPVVLAVDGAAPYLPSPDPLPYLRTIVERAVREGVKALPASRIGPAGSVIPAYAEEVGAGLIFMSTHGRTGLSRLLLGSVAELILRRAPCPVLVQRVVQDSPAGPEGVGIQAVNPAAAT